MSERKETKLSLETELMDLLTVVAKNNFQSRTEFIRRACIEKMNNILGEEIVRDRLSNRV
jgi:metal-responsive CopG/Arc/MetJ family transcriptional regulator